MSMSAVLQQYEKNKKSANQAGLSEEERLKKYFNVLVPKGLTTVDKRIRILPTNDDSSPFKEARYHEIQVGKQKLKLYDPAQDGEPSPLNEVAEALKMEGTEEAKKMAVNYYSRKFYIVKVIDRDNEADGVKFWRFKHHTKGDGIYDKIIPVYRNKGNIHDALEGRDLIVTLELTKSNNGKEYTSVKSIIHDDKSPLHTNQEVMDEWLSNTETYMDVFPKKPFEFLDLVARGETPKWDNNLKKYVPFSDEEQETTISNNTPTTPLVQTPAVDPQSQEEPEDDLPF